MAGVVGGHGCVVCRGNRNTVPVPKVDVIRNVEVGYTHVETVVKHSKFERVMTSGVNAEALIFIAINTCGLNGADALDEKINPRF